MSKAVDKYLSLVDAINKKAGLVAGLLIPVIMLITSYEVIARYCFQAPTIWAWDINVQIFALIIFFGGGYLMLYDGHVRVDVIYGNLSDKWKNILDLVTSPVLFMFLVILFWKFVVMTVDSVEEREVTSTLFAPPVYPLKVLCSIGLFFFLLQAVARLIRNVRNLRSLAGSK